MSETTITMEAIVTCENPSFKAPDIEKPVKCLMCGRFSEHIKPDKATHDVPVGHYCKFCDWHDQKKCTVGQVLTTDLIEIIKLAPNNPVIRAQIMAKCLHQVPDDKKDWPSIKSWIEFEIGPPKSLTNLAKGEDDLLWNPIAPGRRPDAAFSFEARVTDVERGRCIYSVERSGHSRYGVTLEDITEAINNCGAEADRVAVFRELREILYNKVEENLPDMNPDEEYEYESYNESDDSQDESNITVDWQSVEQMFRDYLNSNPDLRARVRA